MSASALPHMTADEFIDWSLRQPEGQRYELIEGEVVGMASQRSRHGVVAARIMSRMLVAIEAARLPCLVYGQGMAVAIDSGSVYEPDAMVQCGTPVPDEAVIVTDPLIVVEVGSPSTAARDNGVKLAGYFRVPSLRHYLVVVTAIKTVIHHHRDPSGTIVTRIVRDGALTLDPPGITIGNLFD